MNPGGALYPLVFFVIVYASVASVVGFFVRQKGPLVAIVGAMATAIGAMGAFFAPASGMVQAGLGAFLFAGLVMAPSALIVNGLRKWKS